MVIHKSDICIKLQLSVLMIAGSYYGFLLNAGLVCGGHHEIFSHASTAGTGWVCENLCTKRVWLRYGYGYRFGTSGETLEKREQFHNQRKHKWPNCISRYCKVSLLVVHHIAFHSLEAPSRQKSLWHKDSFIDAFAGFSYTLWNYMTTSSTARGGAGSFKKVKYI